MPSEPYPKAVRVKGTKAMDAKEKLKAIVESARGNDLERVKQNWAGLSEHTLRREHGGNGKSRWQILEGYRQKRREWESAKALLDSLLASVPD